MVDELRSRTVNKRRWRGQQPTDPVPVGQDVGTEIEAFIDGLVDQIVRRLREAGYPFDEAQDDDELPA